MTRPSSSLVGARSLEAWATVRLEAMGVDGVFAPYVIGMLGDARSHQDEIDDEVKFSVHQVLMGWLSPEDEDSAMEFVEELIKFHRNPLLVPVEDINRQGSSSELVSSEFSLPEGELKASAPLFVPLYDSGGLPGLLSAGTSTDGAGDVDHGDDAADGETPSVDVMQDEETFFWSVAFDLVGHLQLKFPEIDPTRLCDLLKLVELDVDRAHAVLKVTLEKETTGITQVCRHYLAGDCRRADCMFVHDTHAVTCRFWLRGMCMQEDNCVFAHDFPEFYALDHAAAQRREYDSEDEDDAGAVLNFDAEEMFPSLGAAKSASTSSTSSTNSWGSQKSDSVSSLSLNFARAVSVQPAASAASPYNDIYGYDSQSRRTPLTTRRPLYHKTAEAVSGSRWLTTGSAVTAQYKQLREEAYELACARNKCFMQATRAYQNGNRSLARSLSAQGHEYNTRMKRCHYIAASQIFEMRNPKSQIYQDRVMDLHGLHVAEAVEFLSYMLPSLADDGLESIHIVTGSGHHSKGPTGNPRLLPAVERFLGTEGYQFVPVADRRGYVGMLMVDLR